MVIFSGEFVAGFKSKLAHRYLPFHFQRFQDIHQSAEILIARPKLGTAPQGYARYAQICDKLRRWHFLIHPEAEQNRIVFAQRGKVGFPFVGELGFVRAFQQKVGPIPAQ